MKHLLLILACLPTLAWGYIIPQYQGWECSFRPSSPYLITHTNKDGSVKLCGGAVKCLNPDPSPGKSPWEFTQVICPYPQVSCGPMDAKLCAETPVEGFELVPWNQEGLRGTGQLRNDYIKQ